MRQLKDFAPGQIVYTQERMDDDEVRETFYVRDPDRPVRYDYDVPVARVGLVQGVPGRRSRVYRIRGLAGACRDPGEADGRTPCRPIEDGGSVWWGPRGEG